MCVCERESECFLRKVAGAAAVVVVVCVKNMRQSRGATAEACFDSRAIAPIAHIEHTPRAHVLMFPLPL